MEDEQGLWAAALGSDADAFAALFDRHRDVVLRQALRLASLPADAEEVVAAAFFELWRKRSQVRLVQGSVLPWLLVTATNLARNSHRALLRREALLRRLPVERDDAESVRAFERIDELAMREDLLHALRALRPRDRALLTLTVLEGYPLAEVAALIGITDNAARVRLHRARKRIRDQLATSGSAGLTVEEVGK